MSRDSRAGRVLITCAICFACVGPLAAQDMHGLAGNQRKPEWMLGGTATGMVTRLDPATMGRSLTEGYLTQPIVRGHLRLPAQHLELAATLDLEGITLRRGELTPGGWGEGYVDRRHPHTYLHEAIASFLVRPAGWRASLSAGKGFAPFGTDDPMVRPFDKFPVNHHLSQVLERMVAVAAVRRGPVLLEAGLFNGDEPAAPTSNGTPARFGDSWSARATVYPRPGLELQASHAFVASPEQPAGGGLDQRKWSASLRWESVAPHAGTRYILAEWALTDELNRGRQAFRFTSLLGEAAYRWSGWGTAIRVERTERPEEERLLDPFRTARPAADFNVVGETRWTSVSVRVQRRLEARPGAALTPFVEASASDVREIVPALFDPRSFYGGTSLVALSAGIRLDIGRRHGRMGRYGVALTTPTMQ